MDICRQAARWRLDDPMRTREDAAKQFKINPCAVTIGYRIEKRLIADAVKWVTATPGRTVESAVRMFGCYFPGLCYALQCIRLKFPIDVYDAKGLDHD